MKIILVDAINTFVDKETGINEHMYDLLETYPNDKIILTNANEEQLETFGLNDMPYEVFTLMQDPKKTDPKYYELLMEEFELKKENLIYFEHNEEAVKSAQSVGIKTYHYDKDKKDLNALKEFLDQNL